MLGVIGLVILSLLLLSVLVVVHEFGHFIVAKRSGVLVEEFGVGLPPRIWSKKIGETLYSINAIPLGGFVRLHGESGSDQIIDPKRAFVNKGSLPKALIVIAGITVNFLFGILLFALIYTFTPTEKIEPLGYVQILDTVTNSPAQIAGIISGDIVKSINQKQVTNNEEFLMAINENRGKKVILEIDRQINEVKETKKLTVSLRDVPPQEGSLGVEIRDSLVTSYYAPLWQRPFIGIKKGLADSFALTKAIFFGLGGVATQASKGQVPEELSGPFKMIAIFVYILRQGLFMTMNLMAVISINLAIFNILPIPPLDGSKLMVIIGEKLFGRKLSPKIENFVNVFGMGLLLALVIFITAREIPEFISSGSITNFVEKSLKIQ